MRLLAAAGLRGPASRQISVAAVPIGGPIKQVLAFGGCHEPCGLPMIGSPWRATRRERGGLRVPTWVLTAEDLS
jgi:hypothetical protein